jgi:hypothetical protein
VRGLGNDLPEGPAETDWLIIPNWGKFQHYRDRNPTWIKVYAKLLHDPDYLGLSLASKGLLQVVWLAYSQCGQRLTVARLRKLCHDRFGYPQLIALNEAGFLYWSASEPLAPSTEKEKEKESPSALTDEDAERVLLQRALDVAADWTSGTSEEFDKRLDELERQYESRLPIVQRMRLWDEALKREHHG